MKVTEGVAGMWHYHLSHDGSKIRALCGAPVMATGSQLEDWGLVFGEHFPKRPTYCKECDNLWRTQAMQKFRKKPVVIEAAQLTTAAFSSTHPNLEHIPGVTYDPLRHCAFIRTLEGEMRAEVGDWIIRGVEGELYPCKPSVFWATYEEVKP